MKDPAFLFYSQDFLTGTLIMPFDERGRYITLLCYMHQNGRIDQDTIRLLVGSFSDTLRSKFLQDENGLFYNERLEQEIDKRRKFIESRTNNGKLGGRPSKTNPKNKSTRFTSGKPRKNLCENENENENEVKNVKEYYLFKEFWDDYDKKVGKLPQLQKKWDTISENDRKKIKEYIPLYKQAQPDKKFRKNPETFLNNQSWNDEIISVAPKSGSLPISPRTYNNDRIYSDF